MSSTIHPLPSFGLGTFRLTGQVVVDSVRSALELGYRAIDTAQIYGNEADIGRAIAESRVPRSELFLTTKVWVDNYAREKLLASLRESLEKLRTDRLDLVLIHWPAPGNGVELAEYMAALAEAKSLGLTRREGPPRCMSGAAEAPVARPVQSSMRYSITPGLSATQSYRRCALWLLSWVCQ